MNMNDFVNKGPGPVNFNKGSMKKAGKVIGDWRLEGCRMYVTLEPCQMCAGAIIQARFDRVVIGAMNKKASGVDGANYNDFNTTGFFEALGNSDHPTENAPNGNNTNNNFYVIVQQRAASYFTQIATSVRSDKSMYIRSYTNSTWSDWVEMKYTDENVSQTNTTTNANYRVLFSGTADDTDRTEIARKSLYMRYNPNTYRLFLRGTTSASVSYGATNPAIRFENSNASQNIELIFSDHDVLIAPASLALIGNQGNESFLAPKIRAWDFTNNKTSAMLECNTVGTTSTTGLGRIVAGNNIASGTAGNASGSVSIYGASTPSMPYSIPWANSLFEDNAEFGFGMKVADEALKNQIVSLIRNNKSIIKNSEKDIYNAYCNEQNEENSKALLEIVDDTKIDGLLKLKDFILPKSVWMIGGDGWAYDIGYNGIDHVLANKENVNILVLDTEVYSNTGGQASKSTRTGAVAKFAAGGKETAKKNLAKIAMSYPHVYVGTISLGANAMQAIKVMKEAEAYNGPSIIIAYAPCIAQGIIKGMKNSINEEKTATQSGYFPLFHYNPESHEFKLDSKADFSLYDEFTLGEDRYRSLKKINKEGDILLNQNKEQAEETYKYYESLVDNE